MMDNDDKSSMDVQDLFELVESMVSNVIYEMRAVMASL